MALVRLRRWGAAMTAVTVTFGAIAQAGHVSTAALLCVAGVMVVCALCVTAVMIVRILSQPEVVYARMFRRALDKAGSPEEREHVLRWQVADRGLDAPNHASVTPIVQHGLVRSTLGRSRTASRRYRPRRRSRPPDQAAQGSATGW
jgi:hypothetical protein